MAPASQHRPTEASHVLLTGASGTLGRVLAPGLATAGHRLRLNDLVPFPDPMPGGASFAAADITDKAALAAACPDDVTDIVHFGGINTEKDPEAILRVNIWGTLNVFELARERRARVIFASSNHAIGFYPRTQQPLAITDPYRPDGHYGVSKVYAEALGRLYHDKHGIESVHLRIGSCLQKPLETRNLATWLSYPDLVRLVLAALAAPEVGYGVVWGFRPIRAAGGQATMRTGSVSCRRTTPRTSPTRSSRRKATRSPAASRAALIAASAIAGTAELGERHVADHAFGPWL